MFFSIIIPLYNRPQEIDELLHTLTKQSYLQFEVLIIEDGSKIDAKAIVDSYSEKLDIIIRKMPDRALPVITALNVPKEIILLYSTQIASYQQITLKRLKITCWNIS